jgi:hypothetical protein
MGKIKLKLKKKRPPISCDGPSKDGPTQRHTKAERWVHNQEWATKWTYQSTSLEENGTARCDSAPIFKKAKACSNNQLN